VSATPGVLETARRLVDLARRAGAEQCDVLAVRYDESEVNVRLGEVDRLIDAGSRSLGLRVINGGRTALCSTSDFSDTALEQLARETVELARISEPDEFAGLPDPALLARPSADGLQLYDESIEGMTVEQKIAMAVECEAAGRAYDPRITNSDGASVSTRTGEVALANSLGFAASYPSSSVSVTVELMADDADGKKRNAYWYSMERSLHRLADVESIGRIAARRAVDQLGARKVGTKQVPVVFEPIMAASLLREVAACANGASLYRGATFLASLKGTKVGSELFTLEDDPLQPARGGSRPFDGEGVTARRTVLFESGVFRDFLFDSYTGRRTTNPTTGSAHRGVESLPSPGSSNLFLRAGESTPEEIVEGVVDGLYVTSLMGQGFNPTTGDYSRGCGGFWIENGRIAYPVGEINISGNMKKMLADIDAAGADLTWFGSVAAPTLRISEMTVSGL